jgi:hypothetical protein
VCAIHQPCLYDRPCSNLKVELSEHTNKFAWFRIMPKFKVRTEGDQIRVFDQASVSAAV